MANGSVGRSDRDTQRALGARHLVPGSVVGLLGQSPLLGCGFGYICLGFRLLFALVFLLLSPPFSPTPALYCRLSYRVLFVSRGGVVVGQAALSAFLAQRYPARPADICG